MSRLLPFASLLLAAVLLWWLRSYALLFGTLALPVRALIVAPLFVFSLLAVRPLLPAFLRGRSVFAGFFVIPVVFFVALYYFMLLPQRAGEGVRGEQLLSALITDASSNGFVEIGFSNPIYTPTIEFENAELFTREVELFLRLTNTNDEVSLYRAIRDEIPGSALSVEASVKGLLSENDAYLFNPVRVAPLSTRRGRVVFVISDIDDGRSFSQTLKQAKDAQFELREPGSGTLVDAFPLIAL
jgi:hypothetical protein